MTTNTRKTWLIKMGCIKRLRKATSYLWVKVDTEKAIDGTEFEQGLVQVEFAHGLHTALPLLVYVILKLF